MVLIPPTADHVAPPLELPGVEGSGRSAEVSQPESQANRSKKQSEESVTPPKCMSWADQAEQEEVEIVAADGKEVPNQNTEDAQPLIKSFSDVVKSNGHEFEGDLDFIIPDSTVVFTKEEWEEGNMLFWGLFLLLNLHILMCNDG